MAIKRKKHAVDRSQSTASKLFKKSKLVHNSTMGQIDGQRGANTSLGRPPDRPTRRADLVSDQAVPPALLLNLIATFLADYGFQGACRMFALERQDRGKLEKWKDPSNGQLPEGQMGLNAVFDEWCNAGQKDHNSELSGGSEVNVTLQRGTKSSEVITGKETIPSSVIDKGKTQNKGGDVAMKHAPAAKIMPKESAKVSGTTDISSSSDPSSSDSSSSDETSSSSSEDSDADDEKDPNTARSLKKAAPKSPKIKTNPISKDIHSIPSTNTKRKGTSRDESTSNSESTSEDEPTPKKRRKNSSAKATQVSAAKQSAKVDIKAAIKTALPVSETETSSENSSEVSIASSSEPEVKTKKAKRQVKTTANKTTSDSSVTLEGEPIKIANGTASFAKSKSKGSASKEHSYNSMQSSSVIETNKRKRSSSPAVVTEPEDTTQKEESQSQSAAILRSSGNDTTSREATKVKAMNKPFSRIPDDVIINEKLASNAYVPYDYAERAHRDLIVTKGKGFTKEKNKKKRGSYRGGAIDVDGRKGIKFDD